MLRGADCAHAQCGISLLLGVGNTLQLQLELSIFSFLYWLYLEKVSKDDLTSPDIGEALSSNPLTADVEIFEHINKEQKQPLCKSPKIGKYHHQSQSNPQVLGKENNKPPPDAKLQYQTKNNTSTSRDHSLPKESEASKNEKSKASANNSFDSDPTHQTAIPEPQYSFIDPLPEDLTCSICRDTLHQAVFTDCCLKRICESCLRRIELFIGHTCSFCRSSTYRTHSDTVMRYKIGKLKVKCTKERCLWIGEYKDLHNHLGQGCIFVKCTSTHSVFGTKIQHHDTFSCTTNGSEITLPPTLLVSFQQASVLQHRLLLIPGDISSTTTTTAACSGATKLCMPVLQTITDAASQPPQLEARHSMPAVPYLLVKSAQVWYSHGKLIAAFFTQVWYNQDKIISGSFAWGTTDTAVLFAKGQDRMTAAFFAYDEGRTIAAFSAWGTLDSALQPNWLEVFPAVPYLPIKPIGLTEVKNTILSEAKCTHLVHCQSKAGLLATVTQAQPLQVKLANSTVTAPKSSLTSFDLQKEVSSFPKATLQTILSAVIQYASKVEHRFLNTITACLKLTHLWYAPKRMIAAFFAQILCNKDTGVFAYGISCTTQPLKAPNVPAMSHLLTKPADLPEFKNPFLLESKFDLVYHLTNMRTMKHNSLFSALRSRAYVLNEIAIRLPTAHKGMAYVAMYHYVLYDQLSVFVTTVNISRQDDCINCTHFVHYQSEVASMVTAALVLPNKVILTNSITPRSSSFNFQAEVKSFLKITPQSVMQQLSKVKCQNTTFLNVTTVFHQWYSSDRRTAAVFAQVRYHLNRTTTGFFAHVWYNLDKLTAAILAQFCYNPTTAFFAQVWYHLNRTTTIFFAHVWYNPDKLTTAILAQVCYNPTTAFFAQVWYHLNRTTTVFFAHVWYNPDKLTTAILAQVCYNLYRTTTAFFAQVWYHLNRTTTVFFAHVWYNPDKLTTAILAQVCYNLYRTTTAFFAQVWYNQNKLSSRPFAWGTADTAVLFAKGRDRMTAAFFAYNHGRTIAVFSAWGTLDSALQPNWLEAYPAVPYLPIKPIGLTEVKNAILSEAKCTHLVRCQSKAGLLATVTQALPLQVKPTNSTATDPKSSSFNLHKEVSSFPKATLQSILSAVIQYASKVEHRFLNTITACLKLTHLWYAPKRMIAAFFAQILCNKDTGVFAYGISCTTQPLKAPNVPAMSHLLTKPADLPEFNNPFLLESKFDLVYHLTNMRTMKHNSQFSALRNRAYVLNEIAIRLPTAHQWMAYVTMHHYVLYDQLSVFVTTVNISRQDDCINCTHFVHYQSEVAFMVTAALVLPNKVILTNSITPRSSSFNFQAEVKSFLTPQSVMQQLSKVKCQNTTFLNVTTVFHQWYSSDRRTAAVFAQVRYHLNRTTTVFFAHVWYNPDKLTTAILAQVCYNPTTAFFAQVWYHLNRTTTVFFAHVWYNPDKLTTAILAQVCYNLYRTTTVFLAQVMYNQNKLSSRPFAWGTADTAVLFAKGQDRMTAAFFAYNHGRTIAAFPSWGTLDSALQPNWLEVFPAVPYLPIKPIGLTEVKNTILPEAKCTHLVHCQSKAGLLATVTQALPLQVKLTISAVTLAIFIQAWYNQNRATAAFFAQVWYNPNGIATVFLAQIWYNLDRMTAACFAQVWYNQGRMLFTDFWYPNGIVAALFDPVWYNRNTDIFVWISGYKQDRMTAALFVQNLDGFIKTQMSKFHLGWTAYPYLVHIASCLKGEGIISSLGLGTNESISVLHLGSSSNDWTSNFLMFQKNKFQSKLKQPRKRQNRTPRRPPNFKNHLQLKSCAPSRRIKESPKQPPSNHPSNIWSRSLPPCYASLSRKRHSKGIPVTCPSGKKSTKQRQQRKSQAREQNTRQSSHSTPSLFHQNSTCSSSGSGGSDDEDDGQHRRRLKSQCEADDSTGDFLQEDEGDTQSEINCEAALRNPVSSAKTVKKLPPIHGSIELHSSSHEPLKKTVHSSKKLTITGQSHKSHTARELSSPQSSTYSSRGDESCDDENDDPHKKKLNSHYEADCSVADLLQGNKSNMEDDSNSELSEFDKNLDSGSTKLMVSSTQVSSPTPCIPGTPESHFFEHFERNVTADRTQAVHLSPQLETPVTTHHSQDIANPDKPPYSEPLLPDVEAIKADEALSKESPCQLPEPEQSDPAITPQGSILLQTNRTDLKSPDVAEQPVDLVTSNYGEEQIATDKTEASESQPHGTLPPTHPQSHPSSATHSCEVDCEVAVCEANQTAHTSELALHSHVAIGSNEVEEDSSISQGSTMSCSTLPSPIKRFHDNAVELLPRECSEEAKEEGSFNFDDNTQHTLPPSPYSNTFDTIELPSFGGSETSPPKHTHQHIISIQASDSPPNSQLTTGVINNPSSEKSFAIPGTFPLQSAEVILHSHGGSLNPNNLVLSSTAVESSSAVSLASCPPIPFIGLSGTGASLMIPEPEMPENPSLAVVSTVPHECTDLSPKYIQEWNPLPYLTMPSTTCCSHQRINVARLSEDAAVQVGVF